MLKNLKQIVFRLCAFVSPPHPQLELGEAQREDHAVGEDAGSVRLLSFGPISSTCRQVTLGKLLMLYLPWFICKMEIITKVPTSEIIAFIIIKWENP